MATVPSTAASLRSFDDRGRAVQLTTKRSVGRTHSPWWHSTPSRESATMSSSARPSTISWASSMKTGCPTGRGSAHEADHPRHRNPGTVDGHPVVNGQKATLSRPATFQVVRNQRFSQRFGGIGHRPGLGPETHSSGSQFFEALISRDGKRDGFGGFSRKIRAVFESVPKTTRLGTNMPFSVVFGPPATGRPCRAAKLIAFIEYPRASSCKTSTTSKTAAVHLIPVVPDPHQCGWHLLNSSSRSSQLISSTCRSPDQEVTGVIIREALPARNWVCR